MRYKHRGWLCKPFCRTEHRFGTCSATASRPAWQPAMQPCMHATSFIYIHQVVTSVPQLLSYKTSGTSAAAVLCKLGHTVPQMLRLCTDALHTAPLPACCVATARALLLRTLRCCATAAAAGSCKWQGMRHMLAVPCQAQIRLLNWHQAPGCTST